VVITLLLEKYGLLPQDLRFNPAPILVTVFDQECLLPSFKLASDLRRAGLNVVCYPEVARLQKQFKYADRIGAKVTLVLGPDEVANDQVTVKNLINGDQVSTPRDELVDRVRSIMGQEL
jgi:histidyl-tRNA synthetase